MANITEERGIDMAYFTQTLHMSQPRTRTTGLLGYMELYRQRRALARMDAAQLDDLGLTLEQAKSEARRMIWDAPNSWLR